VETTSGQGYGRQTHLLDGQTLFTGLFHMYAAIYKEKRDNSDSSIMESGQENVSTAEENKHNA
jgi:hypothetical protein